MGKATEAKGSINWAVTIVGTASIVYVLGTYVRYQAWNALTFTENAALFGLLILFAAIIAVNFRGPFETHLRDWVEWSAVSLPVLVITTLATWSQGTSWDWTVIGLLLSLLAAQAAATFGRRRAAKREAKQAAAQPAHTCTRPDAEPVTAGAAITGIVFYGVAALLEKRP